MRAALSAWAFALPVPVAALDVVGQDGAVLVRLEIAQGVEWCLEWNHSVTGGPVADCFETRGGELVLTRSYLHDFAAGLGHMPGRGVQRAAEGGGYWIEAIDEAVAGNALALRVGAARVGHRLVVTEGAAIDLSGLAAGQRVTLRPGLPPGRSAD